MRITGNSVVPQIRRWGFESANVGESESDNPFSSVSSAGRTWERARQMRHRWLQQRGLFANGATGAELRAAIEEEATNGNFA